MPVSLRHTVGKTFLLMIDFMVIFWILLLSQKNRARHHTRKRTDETSLACASDYVLLLGGQTETSKCFTNCLSSIVPSGPAPFPVYNTYTRSFVGCGLIITRALSRCFCFTLQYFVLYSLRSIYSVSYSAARQASSGLFAQRPARAAATNRWMRFSSHAGALCSRLILSRLQFP